MRTRMCTRTCAGMCTGCIEEDLYTLEDVDTLTQAFTLGAKVSKSLTGKNVSEAIKLLKQERPHQSWRKAYTAVVGKRSSKTMPTEDVLYWILDFSIGDHA